MSTVTVHRPTHIRHIHVLGIVLWLAAVVTGVMALVVHSNEPGESEVSQTQVPAGQHLQLNAEKPTLVMFAHPQCPCSRASVRELARIVGPYADRVEVQILFYCPSDESEDWAHTELWDLASQVASVQPRIDRDGQAASAFGVKTSGHALMFAATGEMLYSGGVTSGRAHEGESACGPAIQGLLRGDSTEFVELPAFGCPLYPASEVNHE